MINAFIEKLKTRMLDTSKMPDNYVIHKATGFNNGLQYAIDEAAALLPGEDWKEDGMPLPELIEETWDSHSQLIGSDIDDLQYWSGRDVMKATDFEKAVNEIVTKIKNQ